MKSLQINNVYRPGDPEKERYSDLKVMQSAAGFYVGTEYEDPDFGASPGSRESGYFSTAKEAEVFLARLVAGDLIALTEVRMWP